MSLSVLQSPLRLDISIGCLFLNFVNLKQKLDMLKLLFVEDFEAQFSVLILLIHILNRLHTLMWLNVLVVRQEGVTRSVLLFSDNFILYIKYKTVNVVLKIVSLMLHFPVAFTLTLRRKTLTPDSKLCN